MICSFDDVQVLAFIVVGLLATAELWSSFLIPVVLVLKVGWSSCGIFCGIGYYRMSYSYLFLEFPHLFSTLRLNGIGMSGRCGYRVAVEVGYCWHASF